MTHPKPDGGDCLLVRAPNASATTPTTSEADQALGRTWLNYALLSGNSRIICGKQLGVNRWLYCDGQHAWKVGISESRNRTTGISTVSLRLYSSFGILREHADPPAMEIRTLATLQQPMQYSDINFGQSYSLFTSPKPDGSGCMVNMYYGQTASERKVYAILRATISGTGSLEDGEVGDGITGSLSVVNAWDDGTGMETTGNPTSVCTGFYSTGMTEQLLGSVYGTGGTEKQILRRFHVGYTPPGYGTVSYCFKTEIIIGGSEALSIAGGWTAVPNDEGVPEACDDGYIYSASGGCTVGINYCVSCGNITLLTITPTQLVVYYNISGGSKAIFIPLLAGSNVDAADWLDECHTFHPVTGEHAWTDGLYTDGDTVCWT